jgi:immune inhibitor A
VEPGTTQTIDLGPHELDTTLPQGVVVNLPKKQVPVPGPTPPTGAMQWWSGKADNIDHTLSRTLTLPAGQASLTFQAWWNIEDCGPDACDYAYIEVDDGSGGGYAAIPGSITVPAEGNGIDGTSDGWRPATFDLSPFAGKTIGLRFRYVTDPSVGGSGFLADDITVTAGGTTVFNDGAENGTAGWAVSGFSIRGASLTTEHDNFYVGSYRTYNSFGRYMETGPFNYGFTPDHPRLAERFPYQQGFLLSYWDTSQEDNSTSTHPGEGLILPIDAHPDLFRRVDRQPWGPRIQAYDAPFGLRSVDALDLHVDGRASPVSGRAGVATFDDSRSYYREDTEAGMRYGVKVPANGGKITVLASDGNTMRIKVTA